MPKLLICNVHFRRKRRRKCNRLGLRRKRWPRRRLFQDPLDAGPDGVPTNVGVRSNVAACNTGPLELLPPLLLSSAHTHPLASACFLCFFSRFCTFLTLPASSQGSLPRSLAVGHIHPEGSLGCGAPRGIFVNAVVGG